MESLADETMIELGIKTVEKRLRSARIQTIATTIVSRLLSLLVLLWLLTILYSLLDPTRVPQGHITTSFTLLMLYLQNFAMLLFTLPFMLFFVFGGAIGSAIYIGARSFFAVGLFRYIDPPSPMTAEELYGTASADPGTAFISAFAYLFQNDAAFRLENRATIVMLGFFIVGLSMLAFLFRAEMRTATTAFLTIQLTLFYGIVKLVFDQETLAFSTPRNLADFFATEVILIALVSYLFLEITMQTSYIGQILNPVQQRQKRVLKSMERLKEFKLGVKEEEVKPKGEKSAESEEKPKIKQEETRGGVLKQKMSKTLIAHFVEKASDSLFKKEGGRRDQLTSRLQRYHATLQHADPTVDEKIVGSSVAVTPLSTIMYVGISIVTRIAIMVFGLYAILNIDLILFVLGFPPAIYNSIEVLEPEGIIILLLPMIVFVLLLTQIIGWAQERFASRAEAVLDLQSRDDIEAAIAQADRAAQRETTAVSVGGTPEDLTEEDYYKKLEEEISDKS